MCQRARRGLRRHDQQCRQQELAMGPTPDWTIAFFKYRHS